MNKELEIEVAIRDAEQAAANAKRKGAHGAARKHYEKASRLRKKLRNHKRKHG